MSTLQKENRPGESQRRSKRLPLQVPVLVYGRSPDTSPFHEAARMLSLNAYGGLLALAAQVQQDQTILLVNWTTMEEQECRVVSVGTEQNGMKNVGIGFLGPARNFWRIDFPPADPEPLVR